MNDTYDLNNGPETDWSIPYYDNMTQEQQQEITDSIRLLLRQTFVLERKYDKKTERLQYTSAYRTITKHFPFIRPSHVTMEFGEPFYIKELPAEDRKRAGAYTEAKIKEMLVREQEERKRTK